MLVTAASGAEPPKYFAQVLSGFWGERVGDSILLMASCSSSPSRVPMAFGTKACFAKIHQLGAPSQCQICPRVRRTT